MQHVIKGLYVNFNGAFFEHALHSLCLLLKQAKDREHLNNNSWISHFERMVIFHRYVFPKLFLIGHLSWKYLQNEMNIDTYVHIIKTMTRVVKFRYCRLRFTKNCKLFNLTI